MMDRYSKEERSELMCRVRTKNTRPELLLRQVLYRIGVRGWRLHRRDLPGSPDLAFGRRRVAVFVDGAFWHGHPKKFRAGQSGRFWDEKIARNIERDRRADSALEEAGWTVVRVWDFEIEGEPEKVARMIAGLLDERLRLSEDRNDVSGLR